MPESFATSAEGLLLAANGRNEVLRWDGLDWEMSPAGIVPPQAAPRANVTGAGPLRGTYYCFLRYVDLDGNVSDLSPLSETITAAGHLTISYTEVEVPANPRVHKRQILRNTAGQTRVFYVDYETENLTHTTFSSSKTDSELAAEEAVTLFDAQNQPLANRHAPPPDTKAFVAAHLARMFLAGEAVVSEGAVAVTFGSKTVTGLGTEWWSTFAGRFLWVSGASRSYEIASVDELAQTLTLVEDYADDTAPYAQYAIRPALPERRLVQFSESGLPESWPPTNALSVQEDGDDIVGLLPLRSFLYIVERRHIYRLTYQDDPIQDGFVFPAAARGCVNHRSWVVVDERAWMLDESGIYSFSGRVEELSGPIQDLFEPSRGRPGRYKVRWERKDRFHACYDPAFRIIRWFVCLDGSRLPRHALTLDLERNTWWVEEYPFLIGSSCLGTLDGERRVLLGSSGGKVYVLGEGTLDALDPSLPHLRGSVTLAHPCTLRDDQAQFSSAVVGTPVVIVSGRGKGQRRIVRSATATTLVLDRPWQVRPDTTSVYQLGGVQYRYRTGWFRWVASTEETPRRLEIQFAPCNHAAALDARLYLDRSQNPVVWDYDYTSDQADGFASTAGETDWVADLTRPDGFVQRSLDGGKDLGLDGARLISWELAGTTHRDEVVIYQVSIDGARSGRAE